MKERRGGEEERQKSRRGEERDTKGSFAAEQSFPFTTT
jgi:hypothetical protein